MWYVDDGPHLIDFGGNLLQASLVKTVNINSVLTDLYGQDRRYNHFARNGEIAIDWVTERCSYLFYSLFRASGITSKEVAVGENVRS